MKIKNLQERRSFIVLIFFTVVLFAVSSCQSPTASSRPRPQEGVDSDGDWVSDLDEMKYGSDPSQWDTDSDGATDFSEIFIVGSDPTVAEENSDEDCCRDITEQTLYETDPQSPDEDEDGDRIPDSVELKMGSHPGKPDTDGDLLSDFIEIFLTKTDPTIPDPIDPNGFPSPLLEWMPDKQQSMSCSYQVEATIDQLVIVDPEEADNPDSNIVGGDEAFLSYGLWVDVPDPDDTLLYVWDDNSRHSRGWQGDVYQDDVFDNFPEVPVVAVNCGQLVTFAIQVWESDAPWGGYRDFGIWLDHVPFIIGSIPPAWDYNFNSSMYFEGTGGDSDYYRYDIEYSLSTVSDN